MDATPRYSQFLANSPSCAPDWRWRRAQTLRRPEPGRIPRVTRLMALALKFDTLLRDQVVSDLAALARLGQVNRARISQIMNLTCLATDIQEDILFLPRTLAGHDAFKLADLQKVALEPDWQRQRELWKRLKTTRTR